MNIKHLGFSSALLISVTLTLLSCNKSSVHNVIGSISKIEFVPDGSSPDKVMTIDVQDKPVEEFLNVISMVTGKEVRLNKALSGKLLTYKRTDSSYQDMLNDVSLMKNWKVNYEKEIITIDPK